MPTLKTYKHSWGTETVLNTELDYSVKRLDLQKGWKTSLHVHDARTQSVIVLMGRMGLQLNGATQRLCPAQAGSLQPGQQHRFYGITDAVLILISNHPRTADSRIIAPAAPMEESDYAQFDR